MPSDIVAEGDTDRAVIRAITGLEVPREPGVFGRDNAIRLAAVAAKQLNRRIVLVLDRNGYTPEQLDKEVATEIAKVWGAPGARHATWFVHSSTSSAVRVAIAGLPDDPTLKELGVVSHAVDDYFLLLCLDAEALDEYCKRENLAHRPKAADLRSMLDDLAILLRGRGVAMDSSKRYLDLVRAIVGFQASRTQFAADLIGRCPEKTRLRVSGRSRTRSRPTRRSSSPRRFHLDSPRHFAKWALTFASTSKTWFLSA